MRTRILDIVLALILSFMFAPILVVICVLIKLTSKGPVLYSSKRIGLNNRIFNMIKFRTMRIDTPQLATHLLENPENYLTPLGGFLRKSSLDELPQLINILKGDMVFVGPRPALFNQSDLIALRTEKGVHNLTPGVTGWAQINGRDALSIAEKVAFDIYYLNHKSIVFDMMILSKTLLKVLYSDNIKH